MTEKGFTLVHPKAAFPHGIPEGVSLEVVSCPDPEYEGFFSIRINGGDHDGKYLGSHRARGGGLIIKAWGSKGGAYGFHLRKLP